MAEEKAALIDSIYRKFVRGVSRAIGSDEFYEYFMTAIGNSHREFQFSNRRLIKSVDITWVEKIEGALSAMQNIISTPRNIIKEEELIVNVANAKKAGAETVRHLAVHSALVEDFNEDNGEVRPSRLMQRYREDSIGLYENRLVYTTMELAHHFVKIRHDALLEIISDEFGAKLKVRTDMDCATEHVHMDMFLHIKEIDGILETDAKHGDVLARISRIYRVITAYLGSDFAKEMAKLPRVSGTINKTNVLKKNPDYKVILQLWEFLKNYNDVGYSIRIEEQNPEISERFEENIYRNILFNYLILKGYLDDERDRKIPGNGRIKEKYIKPKVIQKIILNRVGRFGAGRMHGDVARTDAALAAAAGMIRSSLHLQTVHRFKLAGARAREIEEVFKADKVRDELGLRLVVNLARGIHLLDDALVHESAARAPARRSS